MMKMVKEPGIVILAAGQAERFGSPKQLFSINGEALIKHTVKTAVSTGFKPVVAVLGAYADELKKELAACPIDIAVNDHWAWGIGSSIAAGIRTALSIEQNLTAVLLLLADQPLVTQTTLIRLTRAYLESGKKIAACRYQATLGVPALFSRLLFDELLNLPPDAGAKALIKKYQNSDVTRVDAPEAGFDIDRPYDIDRLKAFLDRPG
jgi:molybdenum cofactor cytidylyltransferase